MHGDGGSGRTIVSEKFPIDFVVAAEIVHVHQVSRNLDDVAKLRSRALQDVANVLENGAGLHADVEMGGSEGINLGSGDGVIGASCTGTGDKQKIARALDVRILATGRGLALDHLALGYAHLQFYALLCLIQAPVQR